MKCCSSITVTVILGIVAVLVFGHTLHDQSHAYREFEMAVFSLQWMFASCIAVWFGYTLSLNFCRQDLLFIGVLVMTIIWIAIDMQNHQVMDAAFFVGAAAVGKGVRVLSSSEVEARTFLIGLVLLLALSSWLHLDVSNSVYCGPRWVGLWVNPNEYGTLMSAGVILASGLIAQNLKSERLRAEIERPTQAESADGADWRRFFSFTFLCKSAESADKNNVMDSLRRLLPIILLIAALMMGTGLVMSYSRGAWIGTVIGLLYLATAYGKVKWRSLKFLLFSAFCFLLLIFGVWFFWNTPRTSPWYFQRLDLSRGSVQHRLAAWKAGFEMMRDHPFGLGWNKTVSTYQQHYSPPLGGAGAIVTNDYLMLGTQLGIPALVCFVTYVALCFRGRARHSVRAGLGRQPPNGWQGTANPTLDGGGGQGTAGPTLDGSGGQGTANPTLDGGGGQRTASPTLDGGGGQRTASPTLSEEARRARSDAPYRIACRAGALVCLVAFWFDGGLFKLATASVFWILLELGAERRLKPQMDTDEHR